MVAIRLSRVGKKNHATFRIVVSDKHKDTLGTYLEILGSYDPHQTPTALEINGERAKYWLSVGAQPSDTVYNLLVEKGIVTGPKKKLVKVPPAEPVAEQTATPEEVKTPDAAPEPPAA